MASWKVGVMGAGAIGCWLGGKLVAAGLDVVWVGRPRIQAELAAHGLRLTELRGASQSIRASDIHFFTTSDALAPCEVVLVCVKSAQTEEVAVELAKHLAPGAIVLSMQNGVRNADVLAKHLIKQAVLGGVVGFNVVPKGEGSFHRATTGPLAIGATSDPRVRELVAAFASQHQKLELAKDIRGLSWSKLLMNLNNAVGALSGAPTRSLVFEAEYRRIVAALIEESLDVLRAAGIKPARLGALPPTLFPALLRLPSPLVRVLASVQLRIDPEARSSMWQDLSSGRLTEVDYLNGEIVRIADGCGAPAPINRRIVELVHEAERRGDRALRMSGADLWHALSQPGHDAP